MKSFKYRPVAQLEMSFIDFLILSSGNPFVQRSGSFCAIVVQGIMRNNSVKLLS